VCPYVQDKNKVRALVLDAREFDAALGRTGYRTLVRLADDLKLSRAHLQRIRSGLIPTPELRQRIADKLQVTPDDIWRAVPNEVFSAGAKP